MVFCPSALITFCTNCFNYADVLHLPLPDLPSHAFKYEWNPLLLLHCSLLFQSQSQLWLDLWSSVFETIFLVFLDPLFFVVFFLEFIAWRSDPVFGIQTLGMWVLSVFCWPFAPVCLPSQRLPSTGVIEICVAQFCLSTLCQCELYDSMIQCTHLTLTDNAAH